MFPEPPRWTKKPQSGVYSMGSSGILLCEAEGEPEPVIRWRVNGIPIEGKCQPAVTGAEGHEKPWKAMHRGPRPPAWLSG